MKALIIYFSQTGNTKQIAQKIGDGIKEKGVDVHLLDWQHYKNSPVDDIVKGYDLIGIGFPVFYYQMPFCIKEWLTKFPKVNRKPYFLFSSYAVVLGTAFTDAQKILYKKGWDLLDNKEFLGFGSYQGYIEWPRLAVQFPDYNEEVKAKQFGELQVIKLMCWKNGKTNFINQPKKAERYWLNKSKLSPKWIINSITPKFHLDPNKCTACKKCVKNCPDNAITMQNNKPKFEGNCSRCYVCAKKCPQNAIVNDWTNFRKTLKIFYDKYPDYLKYSDDLTDKFDLHPNHI